jgi:hypothetical protein
MNGNAFFSGGIFQNGGDVITKMIHELSFQTIN